MSETDVTLDERQHLYKLFFDDFGFCGCGEPEAVYGLVRDLLSLAPFYRHPHKVRERIIGQSEDYGPYYMVLYALDSAGLIEHGGVVGGSWLSARGAHYLELMKRHEWDDIDGDGAPGGTVPAGYPHQGSDCAPGCRHHCDTDRVSVSRADLEEVHGYARHFDADDDPAMIRVREQLGKMTA